MKDNEVLQLFRKQVEDPKALPGHYFQETTDEFLFELISTLLKRIKDLERSVYEY